MFLKMQLRKELAQARKTGIYDMLERSARFYGLSLAYVLAIASRETGMRHIEGDWDPKLKRYHGKGTIQIDDRWHKIAVGDYWKDHPQEMIDYGVKYLKSLMTWAKGKWPKFNQYQFEKIAASAYNAGPTSAMIGVNKGDSDLRTTGGNYGRDVMKRKLVLEELLLENL